MKRSRQLSLGSTTRSQSTPQGRTAKSAPHTHTQALTKTIPPPPLAPRHVGWRPRRAARWLARWTSRSRTGVQGARLEALCLRSVSLPQTAAVASRLMQREKPKRIAWAQQEKNSFELQQHRLSCLRPFIIDVRLECSSDTPRLANRGCACSRMGKWRRAAIPDAVLST